MRRLKSLCGVLPAAALGVAAVAIAAGSVLGQGDLPPDARDVIHLPKAADPVAPAPGSLSVVATTQDWQEMQQASTSKRKPR